MASDIPTEQIESTVEAIQSFDAMGIKDELLRSIYSYGFEKPSAIQQRAIVPLMQGRNLIAQAQSGTGKTAAFSIGVLQQIDTNSKVCQAILLSPTRELALQTQEVVKNLSQYLDIKTFACIGGTSVRETIEALRNGVQVVVGTPGRVLDMLDRQAIDPNTVKYLILDEADEMLSQGFKDQMYTILKSLPSTVQVGMFSATMPADALDISKKFMENPVKILVKKEELTLEGIKQFYIDVVKDEYKIDTLIDLYQVISVNQSVIFCNSKNRVEWIQRRLQAHNYPVSITHGDLTMEERNNVLNEFRQGATRILITTDMLSRGIDVQQVSLVINFDMPVSDESYIHRIGRSARFGRKGVAIDFITTEEMDTINRLQKTYETKIVPLPKTFMDYL
ncbi:DEAD/DEAH box helicase, putative [Entamoeba histolytica HM-1:IMSS-B]|uniref:RNA helicase n=10 Tax=Entamoeba TaxID=5758 RepID=C4LYI1_ENTH1|nr:ATP-dependent RNA helicase eIF4A, putative [Entamoeba dispar SAW760]XP_008856954.1 DEAD/DEAH box helicase, putative [Entamoeba nuttalli P19]XP_657280.1 DEAD/DEAH box helicase, putative [Entamoeba histolytica HM-1:IMSS]EMD45802.1 ATP-dependent RNA helicase eIF4A, putative [Entamoeba histolytica KU27]EMH75371.1 DEAD/DEAH box helicase, putative [Entamoeba histolytica HM-1:IMSS-B]EMS13317.1 ATP-dependent RNA helicase eIF4A, putative [Entamoeba histolytica HM-3:IMSS]ENY63961.1 ATP-dependent RNA|eukprot:EDR21906.1 ATP-dependent RNA helicase eIF4A, putative [Entamoeba dispar SAW760]